MTHSIIIQDIPKPVYAVRYGGQGIARQPSAGGDIRGAMIVAAALIEGATFFALIICILLALK